MKRGLNKENSLPDPEFGGESSESARAIHYVVQKDTLMTYVSARFAQADPGIVSGSTIERKKMSTKTIYKRIALVAVTALGAGVLSVAPANAAAGEITVTGAVVKGAAGATTTATGITGNQVIFTFEEQASNGAKLYVNTTSGGTIVSGSATDSGTVAATGTSIANGATWTTGANAGTGTFALTSPVAGTQVVTIQSLDTGTGVYTTVGALTVTWVAAASTDLGSVTGYLLTNGGTCDASTAASTVASLNYLDQTGIDLCVVLTNASGLSYLRSTAIAVVGNGIGKVNDNAVASASAQTDAHEKFDIKGNSLSGKGSFTITATTTNADGTTVNTKTTTVPVIVNGDFTAITLANVKSSIALSTATEAIDYSATDKDGQAAATSGGSAIQWYIESDKGTDPITVNDSNNSSASVSSVTDDGITAATGASSDAGRATVTAGAAYEKLTIWVTKKNAAGATITSNKITVFVSTTTAKSVTVAATKVATGGYTVTVTALSDPATTKTAYPVVDGETVTLGASAGILSATSLTTGKTGNAQFTFYEPQLSGTVLMTAGADLAVGTASLVVANGALDSITTLVNSLIAKINALNKLVVKIQRKVRA
jgi:trimeric autotransporter adhesin